MQVQAYLFFEGRCEEAIAFYRDALGAEPLMLMRYKDSPEPMPEGMVAPGAEDKVMHASFRVGATTVMASDGESTGAPDFRGFALALDVASAAEVDRAFSALAQGGVVRMAPAKTFWSPRFAMVTDRFGVAWMVNATP